MANTNNVVVAALVGVVAGILMGAGTAQYAQVVAFSGADPTAAKYMEPVYVPDGSYRNNRSNNQGIDALYRDNVDVEDADQVHLSANRHGPRHCWGLTRTRFNRCVAEYENGIIYRASQFSR